MKRFVFIVHPLTPLQRKIMALRCRQWGSLSSGSYKYQEVATLCRFRWGTEIEGSVVSIPLLPEELLKDQQRSLELLHHAVCLARAESGSLDVVGLGALCSVVASRGSELQQRLDIPVTTGNAATAWCIYSHTIELYKEGRVAILGSGSPVGRVLTQMLHSQNIPLIVDTKRAGKKLGIPFGEACNIVPDASLVLGCGPTGPSLDPKFLAPNAVLIDVALPQTLNKSSDHKVYMGEAMSMPRSWHRGFWGPLYHLVSGYGWSTVLACLVEPLALVSSNRTSPYAQGARLHQEDILAFGAESSRLGFRAKRIEHAVAVRMGQTE